MFFGGKGEKIDGLKLEWREKKQTHKKDDGKKRSLWSKRGRKGQYPLWAQPRSQKTRDRRNAGRKKIPDKTRAEKLSWRERGANVIIEKEGTGRLEEGESSGEPKGRLIVPPQRLRSLYMRMVRIKEG